MTSRACHVKDKRDACGGAVSAADDAGHPSPPGVARFRPWRASCDATMSVRHLRLAVAHSATESHLVRSLSHFPVNCLAPVETRSDVNPTITTRLGQNQASQGSYQ